MKKKNKVNDKNSVIDVLEKEKNGENKNSIITLRINNNTIKELDSIKDDFKVTRSRLINILIENGIEQIKAEKENK